MRSRFFAEIPECLWVNVEKNWNEGRTCQWHIKGMLMWSIRCWQGWESTWILPIFTMNFVPIFITFYIKKRIHRLSNMASNSLTIHILRSYGRDSPDGILSKIRLFIYATRSNQNRPVIHPIQMYFSALFQKSVQWSCAVPLQMVSSGLHPSKYKKQPTAFETFQPLKNKIAPSSCAIPTARDPLMPSDRRHP